MKTKNRGGIIKNVKLFDYRLPDEKVLNFLEKNLKIKKDEIKYTVPFDFNAEYSFAKGYIILAKSSIIKALYNNAAEEMSFGGYALENNKDNNTKGDNLFKETDNEISIESYDLKNVESVKIITEIIGGRFMAVIDGEDTMLCRFSGSKMAGFDRFEKNFEKIKKGEELTKEDIEGEKKIQCCPKCGTLYPNPDRKICPKCMDKKSIFKRLLGYLKPYKPKLVIMFICYVCIAALYLVYPYLSGTILYDKVLSKDDAFLAFFNLPAGKYVTLLLLVTAAMFLSKLTIQLLGVLHGVLTARIVPEVLAKIKQEVFDSMGKLSINFYTSKQTGGLMTRVLDDANEITSFLIDGLPYFFTNLFTITATAVIMIKLNFTLAAVSLSLVPVLFFISVKLIPGFFTLYGKRHRASRRLNGQLNDNLTGARVVKAFGREEGEIKRFKKNNKAVLDAELSIAKYDNKYFALYSSVEKISYFAVWGVGAILVISSKSLEFGLLITFSAYVMQLNGPLEFMSHVFRMYTQCTNSAQRIFEIIDAVPEVKESENPVNIENIEGDIELKNVTFAYEVHKPVLKDVSFKVNKGEVLGIVGRSGAGKSTLVNLISRLYDVSSGSVHIDGVNVKDISFEKLRKSIAMVSQETYIFMGTVAENIAYARPEATKAEIIAAARAASAHDFICKMPDGYDTIIGSSGRSLSGGEKQRISIARAILANPAILILDEATAAVDTETELAIQESLERLVKGRTTLSIAHRLSTLRNADKLIVIDDGKIAESGTHKELLDKKGIYYKLMNLQTKALAMRGIK